MASRRSMFQRFCGTLLHKLNVMWRPEVDSIVGGFPNAKHHQPYRVANAVFPESCRKLSYAESGTCCFYAFSLASLCAAQFDPDCLVADRVPFGCAACNCASKRSRENAANMVTSEQNSPHQSLVFVSPSVFLFYSRPPPANFRQPYVNSFRGMAKVFEFKGSRKTVALRPASCNFMVVCFGCSFLTVAICV